MRRVAGFLSIVVLAGCTPSEMNLEIESLADSEHPLYDLANTYLDSHRMYASVKATLDCQDESSDACLLRVEALDEAYEGASSSMILHVATGVQPLPGTADPAGPSQDEYGVSPAIYAAMEDVGQDDLVVRYNFDCRYREGDLYLFDAPVVGEPLTGQFDLTLDCTEQLYPADTIPAQVKGTFSTVVQAQLY